MTVRGSRLKYWTPEQAAIAAEIWREHFTDAFDTDDWKTAPKGATTRTLQLIAVAVDRPFDSVFNRYMRCGISFGIADIRKPGRISPQALAARTARREAEDRRGLTAVFFGDPPPGYSALDMRRQDGADA